jgi:hypothetical protein
MRSRLSRDGLSGAIRRLRLREGDIVVVRDPDIARRLSETPIAELKFPVPVIYTPQSIHRLSREYLLKLLARTESELAKSATSAIPSSGTR